MINNSSRYIFFTIQYHKKHMFKYLIFYNKGLKARKLPNGSRKTSLHIFKRLRYTLIKLIKYLYHFTG